MKLPYQIQRTRIAEHGDTAHYRFDLVNVATGKALASAFSRSPVAPGKLRDRQGQLNTRHLFREIEG